MAAKTLPDCNYLWECLDYDPWSGELRWRWRPFSHFKNFRAWSCANGKHAGNLIARAKTRRKLVVKIDDKSYPAAAIIWKMYTGCDPDGEVDHRDRNPFNNRWSNLREATRAQNTQNRRGPAGIVGLKGVYKNGSGFTAEIRADGVRHYLGFFTNAEDAHAAYCEAGKLLHGEYFTPR